MGATINHFKVIGIIISCTFFLHGFYRERAINNFIEFDNHYFILTALLILAIGAIGVFFNNTTFKFTLSSIDITAAMLVVWILIQSVFILSIEKTLLINTLVCSLFLLSYKIFFYDRRTFGILITAFVVSQLLIAGVVITDVSFYSGKLFSEDNNRVNSSVDANYFVSCCPFLLSIYLFSRNKNTTWDRVLSYNALLGFLLYVYLICYSSSRTSWIALFSGLLAIFGCNYMPLRLIKSIFQRRLLFFLSIVFGMLFLIFVVCFLIEMRPDSVKGRLLIYKVSAEMINIHPIGGIGLGRFGSEYNIHQGNYLKSNEVSTDVKLLADNTFHAFNEFLQLTIELGIIGLFIVIFLVVSSFKILIKRATYEGNYLLIGAIASAISIVVSCISSYPMTNLAIVTNLILYLAIVSYHKRQWLSFSINTFKLRYAGIFVIVLSSFFAYREVNRLIGLTRWEKAAQLSLENDFDLALPIYEDIYPVLCDNGRFLFNYGAELSIAGKYYESILILKKAQVYFSHTNLFLYQGINYKLTKNPIKAEQNLLIAKNISPSKFQARYQLLKLYEEIGLSTKGTELAKEIILSPVKVPSQEVAEIKQYAGRYVKTNQKW